MDRFANCDPEQIRQAIHSVKTEPGLRTKAGTAAFDALMTAPDHAIRHNELEGAPNLHLGWFCRHVAIELGVHNPPKYALLQKCKDENGDLILTVLPSIVAALKG